ncbi:MAG: glycoside hydrolase family 2 protein [Candidatus Ratteibacteria bacterium]
MIFLANFFIFCSSLFSINNPSTLSLNGNWQFLIENESDNYDYSDIFKIKNWDSLSIPTISIEQVDLDKTKRIWLKKNFIINEGMMKKNAVLKWQRIYYGADVWINGEKIGGNFLVSPYSIVIPKGLLKSGENSIILSVNAWKSVPRSKSGFPLIPTGASIFNWGSKKPYIEDIWIEFYDKIHLQKILTFPDIDSKKVKFKLWFDFDIENDLTGDVLISINVKPWKDTSTISGTSKKILSANSLKENSGVEIEVPIKNMKLWSPQNPYLYIAVIDVWLNNKLCDEKKVRFGMRELKVKDGNFYLNNKLFYFRGSNLVNEWRWSEKLNSDLSTIKDYIIDWARKMNLNSFRTHTQPPIHRWLDICDENGMLILAEFPITYNYLKFNFTPEEQEIFEKNCISDSLAWISELANHPSIVIWVATNESPNEQEKWELEKLIPEIKKLDPSRPVMRAGKITEDIKDIHCYEGFWFGAEGDFFRVINDVAEFKKRDTKKRPIVNSEYIEGFPSERRLKWTGSTENDEQAQLVYAQFGMEQTESMRRQKYDGIFPYMYGMWTKIPNRKFWKKEFPTPMFASLKSSLSPVCVSIDLFNRNFKTKEKISTPIYIINETPSKSSVKLTYYITSSNPEFLGNPSAFEKPIFKKSEKLEINPYSEKIKYFEWPLPDKEGKYFLSVVLEEKERKVISQRIIRTIEKNQIPEKLKEKTLVFLGSDSFIEDYLKEKEINYSTKLKLEEIKPELIVVWDESKVEEAIKKEFDIIKKYVKEGGKLVIFAEKQWDWKALLNFKIDKGPRYLGSKRSSYAFIKNKNHPIFERIDEEYLKRWNGENGVIADGVLIIEQPQEYSKIETLLWINDEKSPCILELSYGEGKIIVSSCMIKNRLKENTDTFDLSAERLFLNILNW